MQVLRAGVAVCLAVAVGLVPSPAVAQGLTPAFTYQGRLQDGGPPATGPYDFEFALFGSAAGTDQVGPTLTVGDVNVTAGFFTVSLDFGSGVFAGSRRWLEVRVRPGASTGAYTTLSPRQELTAAPNAVFSQVAPWAGLSGVPAGFADNTDNDELGGLSCANGQIAKRSGGAWTCAADADSGGTITGITAGAGLTGGGTVGVVALDVNLAGSGSATTVSRSDHDHLGQLWSGNTAGLNFTVRNTAVDGVGLAGISTATTGFGTGIYAQSNSESGIAVYAVAGSSTGANAGVAGGTSSPAGIGVSGYASSATGFALGVQGHTYSTQGIGVWGYNSNPAATDLPIGVEGRSDSPIGIGVNGFVPATSGANIAVRGATSSPQGWAGYFLGRGYFSTQVGIGTTTPTVGTLLDVNGIVRSGTGGFRFPDGTTQTSAATNPAADITAVTAGTGLTGGGTSGAVTLNVNLAGSGTATTVSRTDHDHVGQTWSSGSGTGLRINSTGSVAVQGDNSTDGGTGVIGRLTSSTLGGAGVQGVSFSSAGHGHAVRGIVNAPTGGGVALYGDTNANSGYAVYARNSSTTGSTTGVYAETQSPDAVSVKALNYATTGTPNGVYANVQAPNGTAVAGVSFASTGNGTGVLGQTNGGGGSAVYGLAVGTTATSAAIRGFAQSATGFAGHFTNEAAGGTAIAAMGRVGIGTTTPTTPLDVTGVVRSSTGGFQFPDGSTQTTAAANPGADITGVLPGTGLTGGGTSGDVSLSVDFAGSGGAGSASRSDHDHFGQAWSGSSGSQGLRITNTAWDAILGISTAAGGYGIYGEAPGGLAGYFLGNVAVSGNLSKGGGSFKIDHPLDPENKYLYHSFVESPDMKNIYDGVVTTDADGLATVKMPEWFEALNRDFRYQLTVIGDGAWARARVFRKIADGHFVIQTDVPGTEVSWQVTGIRKDAFAEKHRIPVEEPKSDEERGTYLHPEAWGKPEDAGLAAKRFAGRER